MAGGQGPGANSRGRGGKFRKFTRGGGKHFSRDLRPLDADGNEVSMWAENGQKKDSDDDSEEESSEEDSSEEEEEDDNSQAVAAAAASREDRKKEKKARKEAAIARAKGQAVQVGDLPSSDDESEDEDLPANPNHSRAARSQTKAPVAAKADVDSAADGIKEMGLSGAAAPQSRRERESLEAQQAKERYRKLHEAGKTDEAKADLARLKIIREKREAEAARKQAEKEEREALEKARKQEIDAREAKLREAALGKPKKGKK
ncbi:hypothetical protein SCUCBS95973_006856 [Sporothrix curviconia]|uniref:Casein kinase substrate phosphoprotein PP28 domain-containing protein n=1 Tax=Sporothrix curviconia TaxID=1260050 RepID=A0ABP0CB45_9PEZI